MQAGGGDLTHLWTLVALELGLAVLSDVLGRAVALLDSLLGDLFTQIAERALYLKDLFDFSRLPRPRRAAPCSRSDPGRLPLRACQLQVSGDGPWVLRDLSFTLRAGETLALVGENGAGKTTLMKLLARLYDPTEGRILLDGAELFQLQAVGYQQGTPVSPF